MIGRPTSDASGSADTTVAAVVGTLQSLPRVRLHLCPFPEAPSFAALTDLSAADMDPRRCRALVACVGP